MGNSSTTPQFTPVSPLERVYERRKNQTERLPRPEFITMDNIDDFVCDQWGNQEYDQIETESLLAIHHQTAPRAVHHPLRDRYSNVFTVEATRVRLNVDPHGGLDDYFPANYITARSGDPLPRVIASQAPRIGNIPLFWQMIWEQGMCLSSLDISIHLNVCLYILCMLDVPQE